MYTSKYPDKVRSNATIFCRCKVQGRVENNDNCFKHILFAVLHSNYSKKDQAWLSCDNAFSQSMYIIYRNQHAFIHYTVYNSDNCDKKQAAIMQNTFQLDKNLHRNPTCEGSPTTDKPIMRGQRLSALLHFNSLNASCPCHGQLQAPYYSEFYICWE